LQIFVYGVHRFVVAACPEGFNEFFNQRRRWMPSTIANIFDLLSDAKHVVDVNKDISALYIMYQARTT
jgi:chitin synthase